MGGVTLGGPGRRRAAAVHKEIYAAAGEKTPTGKRNSLQGNGPTRWGSSGMGEQRIPRIWSRSRRDGGRRDRDSGCRRDCHCHESGPHKAMRALGGGRFSGRAGGTLRGDLAEPAPGRVSGGPACACMAAGGGSVPRSVRPRWSECPPLAHCGRHKRDIDDTVMG